MEESWHNDMARTTSNLVKDWLFNIYLILYICYILYSWNKPPKKYVTDSLAANCGHKVLRLPPDHCIFNPVELIWGISKTFYFKYVGRDANAVETWKETVTHITPTIWNNSVEHVNIIIKTWWERELICDRNEIAPLIINIGEDWYIWHKPLINKNTPSLKVNNTFHRIQYCK
jgi:hypothetical protein